MLLSFSSIARFIIVNKTKSNAIELNEKKNNTKKTFKTEKKRAKHKTHVGIMTFFSLEKGSEESEIDFHLLFANERKIWDV